MVNRVTVVLDQPEYAALLDLARNELRNPSDQLRAIWRKEMQRQGLLPTDDDLGRCPRSLEEG